MLRLLLVAALLAACGKSAPKEAAEPSLCKAEGWRYETIELPPQFAPTMAKGTEKLYFAPGMFKPADPTYFSYVFFLAFREPRTWNIQTVRTLLDTYYRGLITAVAKGKKTEVDAASIKSRVSKDGGGFRATVSLVDTFTNNQRIELNMALTTSGRCVRAIASPAEPGGEVWKTLERALVCVPCPR